VRQRVIDAREHFDPASAAMSHIAHGGAPAPIVQFIAAPSEAAANAFWQSLVRRFPDLLSQHEPTVVRAERDGMVFWRVRTDGFGSPAEARALCARVHAAGQDCFVSTS
jgi:hypothetical protein